MAVHYPADQWRSWFSEFEGSDLTVGQFCKSIGVSINTYYRWRARLASEATLNTAPVEFVSVSLPSTLVEIDLPCGAVVRVPSEPSSLRSVLSVLLELGVSQ